MPASSSSSPCANGLCDPDGPSDAAPFDIRPYGRYFFEWWLLNDVREGAAVWPIPFSVTEEDGRDAQGAPVRRSAHLTNGSEHDADGRCAPRLTEHGALVLREQAGAAAAGTERTAASRLTWPRVMHVPEQQLCDATRA